jgi:hypothetical protein
MPDFITLSCPTCGGKLQITPDIDRFACLYCGAEHIVRRGSGVISLAPVVEGLRQVQTGVDKTAAELAIVRLTQEIERQKQNAIHVEPSTGELLAGGVTVFGGFFVLCLALGGVGWPIVIIGAILCVAMLIAWLVTSGNRFNQERILQKEKLNTLRNQLAANQQLVGS